MKYLIYLLIPIFYLFFGCGDNNEKLNKNSNVENGSTVGEATHIGEVVEKLDAGDYSYLQIKEKDNLYWIAIPLMQIKLGENIMYSKYMEMKNFESKTLNRTFKSVLFVDDANKVADEKTLTSAHSNLSPKEQKDIKVKTLRDGKTIAEIYKNKQSLNGKTVKVKGKVVKFNSGIMNRNWVHIQDGTDDNGNFDLLITSDETVKFGDIIVAEGKLAIDKDFGAGYSYAVLVEEAKIIIE